MLETPQETTRRAALAIAKAALRIAQTSLPAYSSRFSPRKFTQHQIFAIVALRSYCGLDYRSVCRLLDETPELREALGIERVPHYSTLCYAEGRLRRDPVLTRLLGKIFTRAPRSAQEVASSQ